MHSLPLCPWGGTTEPLCSVWTEWAPLWESAKLSCMCLCVRELLCETCREAGKWNTAVVLIVKQAFFNHICRKITFYKRQKQPERDTQSLTLISTGIPNPTDQQTSCTLQNRLDQGVFAKLGGKEG